MNPPSRTVLADRTAVLVRRTITLVVFVIAGLAFAFGFGNGWTLGLELGVTPWIAPLAAPAVDLSVIGLLTTIHYLRTQGVQDRLIRPRLLLVLCGLITFAMNTARSILAHQFGRAAFDGIAPCLLCFWAEVGPQLLMLLHSAALNPRNEVSTVRDDEKIVPNGKVPSAELVAAARQLDAAHRTETNRPITRDKLRAQLQVSSAIASELIRIVRAVPDGGVPS